MGDRVEVEYDGAWFAGEVLSIDVDARMAKIHCDVDLSHVVTETHLDSLRQLPVTDTKCRSGRGAVASDGPLAPSRNSGHRRTRSAC